MHPQTIRAIYRRLQEANPTPTSELNHSTPFELLVAVMLSAHTTDKSVNTAMRVLFPIANTPQTILAMGEDGVKPYLKSVGLYNTKAKNLIELCRRIVEQHGGEIPHDREKLESLPGVGRKTANIILNMVFGESTIAVDTHIFRVSNRTGLAPGKDPRVVEDELNVVTPDEFKKDAHHWLLLHGRYVCVARVPACPKCIIADLCEYELKTPPKDLAKSDAPVAHEKGSVSGSKGSGTVRPGSADLARGAQAKDAAKGGVTSKTAAKAGASATRTAKARAKSSVATRAAAKPAKPAKPAKATPSRPRRSK